MCFQKYKFFIHLLIVWLMVIGTLLNAIEDFVTSYYIWNVKINFMDPSTFHLLIKTFTFDLFRSLVVSILVTYAFFSY